MTDNTTRLLDAAVAEIAEHGPHAATLAAVARRAGLTTGALFARWPDKAALIAAAAVHARSLCGIPLVRRLDKHLRAAAREADWCLEPVRRPRPHPAAHPRSGGRAVLMSSHDDQAVFEAEQAHRYACWLESSIRGSLRRARRERRGRRLIGRLLDS